jgi:hypothetical protein
MFGKVFEAKVAGWDYDALDNAWLLDTVTKEIWARSRKQLRIVVPEIDKAFGLKTA